MKFATCFFVSLFLCAVTSNAEEFDQDVYMDSEFDGDVLETSRCYRGAVLHFGKKTDDIWVGSEPITIDWQMSSMVHIILFHESDLRVQEKGLYEDGYWNGLDSFESSTIQFGALEHNVRDVGHNLWRRAEFVRTVTEITGQKTKNTDVTKLLIAHLNTPQFCLINYIPRSQSETPKLFSARKRDSSSSSDSEAEDFGPRYAPVSHIVSQTNVLIVLSIMAISLGVVRFMFMRSARVPVEKKK